MTLPLQYIFTEIWKFELLSQFWKMTFILMSKNDSHLNFQVVIQFPALHLTHVKLKVKNR
jgi:hypothetical protein